jgi:hypothetical protein
MEGRSKVPLPSDRKWNAPPHAGRRRPILPSAGHPRCGAYTSMIPPARRFFRSQDQAIQMQASYRR